MGGIHYHPANQGIQSGVIWVDWLCWLKYLSFVNDKILGYHFLVHEGCVIMMFYGNQSKFYDWTDRW